LVKRDRIELLAATPLNKGYRVTAGNGEHAPKLLTHSPLCVPILRQRQVVENVYIKTYTSPGDSNPFL
jgi:hypothetical protein